VVVKIFSGGGKMKDAMINGVIVKPLKKIPDERGSIFHMLRCDDNEFEKFGEIYFSLIYPGVVKAWHLHKEMVLNYAVVSGMIKLVLYDDRKKSVTKGSLMELFVGDQNYCLVKIPAGVWNGFKCVGRKQAIVANCATVPHKPDEIVRMDPFTKKVPYNWELKHG
jgi:dTDP-4-dehydrorhamnose 3,5-epimerase